MRVRDYDELDYEFYSDARYQISIDNEVKGNE